MPATAEENSVIAFVAEIRQSLKDILRRLDNIAVRAGAQEKEITEQRVLFAECRTACRNSQEHVASMRTRLKIAEDRIGEHLETLGHLKGLGARLTLAEQALSKHQEIIQQAKGAWRMLAIMASTASLVNAGITAWVLLQRSPR